MCVNGAVSLQAKAEHLAAVEEQRRIREDMYMRQMEEQARLEAEAKAQVKWGRMWVLGGVWVCVEVLRGRGVGGDNACW